MGVGVQCRHTVPDWHRYVDPAEGAVPIFAACRLLVKEGGLAANPRNIACGFWGHQQDCPLFEGAAGRGAAEGGGAERPASRDVPVVVDTVWPVRTPGSRDGMRLLLIGLGVLSIVLVLLTAGIGLALVSGKRSLGGYMPLVATVMIISIVTHCLFTLRVWARR